MFSKVKGSMFVQFCASSSQYYLKVCFCAVCVCHFYLTSIQQQFDHWKVWMWHAVVEGHIPIAVCQVHYIWQEGGCGQADLSQV